MCILSWSVILFWRAFSSIFASVKASAATFSLSNSVQTFNAAHHFLLRYWLFDLLLKSQRKSNWSIFKHFNHHSSCFFFSFIPANMRAWASILCQAFAYFFMPIFIQPNRTIAHTNIQWQCDDEIVECYIVMFVSFSFSLSHTFSVCCCFLSFHHH